MLNKSFTLSALYSKCDIKFSVDGYKKRLKFLTSFNFNTTVNAPMYIYNRIIDIQCKIENLMLLDNIITTAFNLLSEKQKKVVELAYFKRIDREQIRKALGINEADFKYLKRASVNKISFYIYALGLNDERFLTLFNEEALIVRNYESALELSSRVIANYRRLKCGGYKQCIT